MKVVIYCRFSSELQNPKSLVRLSANCSGIRSVGSSFGIRFR